MTAPHIGRAVPRDKGKIFAAACEKMAPHLLSCYPFPMRALVQRVTSASVGVEGETVGKIDTGLLVFVCAMQGDDDAAADYLATKIAKLRVFADAGGKTNLSIHDIGGSVLVVSQFTLAAEWRKGNRPGFSRAAPPAAGERLYDLFCQKLGEAGVPVETGRFAAMMRVALVNDGPFTLWMDTAEN